MSNPHAQSSAAAWHAVEPDDRVRLLPAACITLRYDAASCMSCRSACPVDCIQIDAGSFRVSEQCIGCGHCAAACPTGALTVKGFAAHRDIPADNQPLRVECLKVDRRIAGNALRVPCLGGLATMDWLEMIANAGVRTMRVVDRGWCGQCEVAAKTAGKHPAGSALEKVTDWLKALGLPSERLPSLVAEPLPPALMPKRIPSDAPSAPARRGFFLRLGNEARRAVGVEAGPAIPAPLSLRGTGPMPLPGRERLHALLRRFARDLALPLPGNAFYALEISAACANHTVCAGLCPTQALTRYADAERAGIEFDAMRCIGCGKCAATCPEQALTLKPASTVPANSRVRLTAHAMRTCAECLQTYFESTGDELCPACRRKRAIGAALFKGV